MEIYLVRHGKTKENERGIYYGTMDSGLTEEGRRQMQAMAPFFRQKEWDAIYVSPLGRAIESAKLLLLQADISLEAALEERHFGIFEGKTYEEIKRRYPKEEQLWGEDWMGYEIPEGESFLQVQSRIEEFWSRCQKEHPEQVLIVSHKGTLIQLMLTILGFPPEMYWKFTIEQGCYSMIRISYGNPVLVKLNEKCEE